MTVLSLFDGISCGRVALERAGVSATEYISSEIDPDAITISANNYKDITQIGNVSNVSYCNGVLTAENYNKKTDIDLVIGGSPCQSFSKNSGKQKGFKGESGLFWEFVRVLEEVKPKYFLLENVRMKNEWRDVISQALGVEPIELDSSKLSAQKRPRFYWTNIPNVTHPEDKGIIINDIITGDHKDVTDHEVVISVEKDHLIVRNGTKKGYQEAYDGDGVNLSFPNSKTRRGRVSRQKTNTLDTGCNLAFVRGNRLLKFNITELERLQTLPDNYTEGVSLRSRKSAIGNGWNIDTVSHIFKNLK